MKISVQFDAPCTPDAAWRALHDPASVAAVYGPLLSMVPAGGAPRELRPEEPVIVSLRALGRIPMGRQVIEVRDEFGPEGPQQIRTMHDVGGPLTGPLTLLQGWHHRMSLSPVPGHPDRVHWSDTLEVGGRFAPLFWPVLTLTWRLRAGRIRSLAPRW